MSCPALRLGGRGLRAVAAAALMACVAMTPRVSGADRPQRPNVVFILADDLGWGDLACFGNELVETPRLDRLAREGTRFTSFYVAAPVCSPTRAAILTGLFPGRLGIHGVIMPDHEDNESRGVVDWLEPGAMTTAQVLRSAGYATGLFGKWHLGSTPDAPDPGAYGIDDHVTTVSSGPTFDQVGEEFFRARSTEFIVDQAIEFIEEHRHRPFFVNVWTLLPHGPLDPTEAQLAEYDHLSPAAPWVGARQIFYASITAMDKEIGRLLDRLDELGLADDTLVVFTSDNGPATAYSRPTSHSGVGLPGPFRGAKWSLYEGGIRTPLVVRWPGRVPAGLVNNTSVITAVDFLPTFARLAGLDLPHLAVLLSRGGGADAAPVLAPGSSRLNWTDGEDVSDIFQGGLRPRGRPIFWEMRYGVEVIRALDRSPRVAVRHGQWKLLLNPDGSRLELYDLAADRAEVNNLAAAHPEVAAELSAMALDWLAELPPGPVSETAGRDDYPWPR